MSHPLIEETIALAIAQGRKQKHLSLAAGLNRNAIYDMKTGHPPSVPALDSVLREMGYELVIQECAR